MCIRDRGRGKYIPICSTFAAPGKLLAPWLQEHVGQTIIYIVGGVLLVAWTLYSVRESIKENSPKPVILPGIFGLVTVATIVGILPN